MRLQTPQSAILSAVIFNALIIVALVPLALRGIRYRPLGAAALLRRNLLIYGVGGIIVPFVGIKVDRRRHHGARPGVRSHAMNITRNLVVAVLMTVVTTVLLGVDLSAGVTGLAQVLFPDQANGQLIERDGTVDRLAAHRPGVLVAGLLPLAAVGGRARLRRRRTRPARNLGPTNKKLIDAVDGERRRPRSRRTPARRCRSIS